MSCDRCGADTTRPRLCRECALLESVEHETGTRAPPLYECSECGDERAESPDSTCWLCRSDRHERGDDGTPELRTDGGQPAESGRAIQHTLTGEEAEERQRPETMLWCDECMKYVLRSNRHEHPHDLTPDSRTADDEDEASNEPERVGGMYRVKISYNVDYTFRIPAWTEHEAQDRAEMLQPDAQPSSKFEVHTQTSKLTTLMSDHEKVPDDYDPEGGTPLYEVYGDDE